MAVYRNTFEGGTAGVAVSVPNSGGASGDAFNSVAAGVTYAADIANPATVSASFTTDASAGYAAWYPPAATNLALRGYFYFTNVNSVGEFNLLNVLQANGDVVAVFRVAASNVLRLYKNVAPTSNAWAPTTTMVTGKRIRAEMLVEQGTTTSNGRLRAAIFDNNSLTPIADSGWVSGLNLGAGTLSIAHARFGKGAPNSPVSGVRMDDLALNSGADYTGTWIGPSVVPVVSTAYRWNAGTSAYVPLESYRWDAGTSTYVALDRATP